MGFYIGISGHSVKTEENCEVIKEIPLNRLLVETDSPTGFIQSCFFPFGLVRTHFMKKAKNKYDTTDKSNKDFLVRYRNEPCTVVQIIEIVASLREESISKIINATY